MISRDRRTLIGVAAAAAATPGAALAQAAATNTVRYAILRNGKPFGRYTVAFQNKGDAIVATTDVFMQARVAGLTVFDYRHRCIETWRSGQFVEMSSHSIRDNAADLEDIVTAVRTATGVKVTDKIGSITLPANAAPFTHWNAATLKGPLFNPQTGKILKVRTVALGKSPVTMANGARVTANRRMVCRLRRLVRIEGRPARSLDPGVPPGLRPG